MMSSAPASGWGSRLWRVGWARLAGAAALGGLAVWLARASLPWAAGTLLVAAVGLAILVQPAAGLTVLALLIPADGLLPSPLRGITATDILVVTVVAGWLAQGIVRRELLFRRPPLLWPLLALIWLEALSLTQAHTWSEGLPELFKWIEFAVLYVIAAQILERRYMGWVIAGLLLAGVTEAALGAYQFLRQVGPPAFILAGRFMRAYGTLGQPNPYAGYLGYLAPVAASLALFNFGASWREHKAAHLLAGLLCAGAAIALAAGIGMSWSRGGWLALAACMLAVAGLRNRKAAVGTLVIGAAIAAVLIVGGTGWLSNSVGARLNDVSSAYLGSDPTSTEVSDANFAVLERLAHWQAGIGMFDDHPWLGVGIGNYADAYARYALPHWYDPLGHAHNIYINFLAETGILGACAFLVFWLAAFWLAWKASRATRSAGSYGPALAIGVLGTLVYLTVHNVFDNLFVQHMQLQLALLLACTATVRKERAPA